MIPQIEKHGAQSLRFMACIMPMLFDTIQLGRRYKVLDLGARTGHGTNLLAQTMNEAAQIPTVFDVEASNLTSEEWAWFGAHEWGVKCYIGDVNDPVHNKFLKEQNYDIVIASHMIEHTADPVQTFNNINAIAKERFVIACPWMEQELNHITWKHDSSVGPSTLLDIQGPLRYNVCTDPGYPYCDCFYGVYAGHTPTLPDNHYNDKWIEDINF